MLLDSTVPAGDALRWAHDASERDQSLSAFRSRLTLYVRMLASLIAGMYLVGVVVLAIMAPNNWWEVHRHPSKLVHLAMAAVLVGVWAWLRRRPRSRRAVEIADVAAAVVVSTGVGGAMSLAPSGFNVELVSMFIVALALIMRAAIVPSAPRWTLLVGLAAAVPILTAGYRQALASEMRGFVTPKILMSTMLIWYCASLAVTVVVSRIVYGLTSQVREARRLGQYTLGDKIGEGGMGEVYRAEHAMLRRATAVKLLLPDRVGAEALLRFEREVRLTSQLSHPNTVAIYDYGRTPQGVFFYAMEYLQGSSLEELVAEEGPQPAGRVVHMLAQMAGSLAEAHATGLIHRDIKPSNVLLCTRGGIPDFVKVIDFGLVKRVGGDDSVALTQVNALIGTPLFLAPEGAMDPDGVTSSIDTYALGAVGYFLITGTPPFEGRTLVEICGHHMHTAPTPPSERLARSVPHNLEDLVLRCLAKDPSSRPSDRELLTLLDECRIESPWRVRAPASAHPPPALVAHG